MEYSSNISSILGIPVWGLKLEEFVELAEKNIRENRKVMFTTVNAHSAVVAQKIPEFMAHFKEADVVLPDGISLVLAARSKGMHFPERVAGPDFTEAFLAAAAREGIKVFFMGATEETLIKIRMNCIKKYPGLEIAGTYSPPFGEFDERTNLEIVKSINAASPDALLVGMTAPKQELWLSKNYDKLNVKFMIGVGAAFDYLAGNKKKVPLWIGKSGFEWLFRLTTNPGNVWKREKSIPLFMYYWIKESLLKNKTS